MAAHAATAQNVTLQEESIAQQRTSLAKAKDSNKKPKSQFHCRLRGRKRADEVGVSDGDLAFHEITIHA